MTCDEMKVKVDLEVEKNQDSSVYQPTYAGFTKFTMSYQTLPLTRQDCPLEGFCPGEHNVPNPRQILKIALNLKFLIDETIKVALSTDEIIQDGSSILNSKIVTLAYDACGGNHNDKRNLLKYRSVIIFAILRVVKWNNELALRELHDSELYEMRSLASQKLCKMIIDKEETRDLDFLFMQLLLRKYVINEKDKDMEPMNAVELATDLHCIIVIGSSGFQRCLKWVWRGWILQNYRDPTMFIKDEKISSMKFMDHFNPERIKTPKYQNILQILFAVVFLILYTIVVNGKSGTNVVPLDFWEYIFYLFTLGYISSEFSKFYYIGNAYFSFWTCFNDTLYGIVLTSMIFRFNSLYSFKLDKPGEDYDRISYRILSCAAPFVWSRLLLYLESERIVGALLVVLKHMLQQSIVFFALLLLIMLGFLQGFLGLDSADGKREITMPILTNLIITVFGLGTFDMFDRFAPPYAAILYYGYCFIVTVILLNILIALYANAYQEVIENTDDEYMALMSQKTLRFIRAPDEDVFVAPLNLIEICTVPVTRLLSMEKRRDLNYLIMLILYSPMLLYVAIKEVHVAKRIKYNRLNNLPDDANETDTEWDLTDGYFGFEDSLFDDVESEIGIRKTTLKNKRSLELQREAENVDKHFVVSKEWYKKVQKLKSSSERTTSNGLTKEQLEARLRKTEEKISDLATSINNLTEVIKEKNG
ncbi:Yvc1p NDAI_0B04040 [Naumovozyma dairenensis CBS 421]|uniref:Ion transport domain-containing protein n=1 Tax=Naumovozyma dairenensis (strain ATCC 10597 / BCRC 20456 / CBS 421 / NBRC 0211 / NRRL Y-12639) TaxID=1071378 RepID=G0W6M7_NAUDC|nr:hypothetical protein NDAI_0B04040 [Naumovozyma dairenensis CBS 421]CCD23438.1 hypothetical protein NDAI_0B04040 [Naumovozyma dairenensis CBS 421]